MIGLFGGAFDPPHVGHVELARAALAHFALERLHVHVVAQPGHRPVEASVADRLDLARAAFETLPRTEVDVDHHAYTVDFLRAARPPADAIFLLGADEYEALPTWKEPEEVVRLVRLGVATRHGRPRPRLRPEHEGRVELFEIASPPISSSVVRERVRRGEPLRGLIPDAVADELAVRGLYRA